MTLTWTPCDIKWDGTAFHAYKKGTNQKLFDYINLIYSNALAAPSIIADDALVSIKTLTSASAKTTDVYSGWCQLVT